jgi:hypothetical protein
LSSQKQIHVFQATQVQKVKKNMLLPLAAQSQGFLAKSQWNFYQIWLNWIENSAWTPKNQILGQKHQLPAPGMWTQTRNKIYNLLDNKKILDSWQPPLLAIVCFQLDKITMIITDPGMQSGQASVFH